MDDTDKAIDHLELEITRYCRHGMLTDIQRAADRTHMTTKQYAITLGYVLLAQKIITA